MGNIDITAGRRARQRHGLHWQQALHRERQDACGRWSRSGHGRCVCPAVTAERGHAMRIVKGSLTLTLLALGVTLVHAQNPMLLRWDKAAPFPEPEEELYGVAAGGKM